MENNQNIFSKTKFKKYNEQITNNFISSNITNNYQSLSNEDNNLNKHKIENFCNQYNEHNSENKCMSNLLYQLKQMSDKQIYLLDIISNLQKNSSEQIFALNRRIKKLEDKFSIKDSDMKKDNNIVQYDKNITKFLKGNNNDNLIKYLSSLKLEEIKKIDIKLVEDIIMKLCILLTEEYRVHEILSFIRAIIILNKIKLKPIIKKNLKDIFIFIKENYSNIREEDLIDITLIISYLNTYN